ncbi:ATPase [Proteus vulgaris]|uniref:AAA family ATPase n=1 Tax=Proteus vulgaris TaxID=585 RepID=UPI0018C50F4C|nr:AAA family ATPase [Proteus vulgaris]MBG2712280.1 AAA family ATPase [Proteus mirabilis]MBG2767776.1 AAA family ATPase [Proteus mirabilis]GLX62102.1 ATPase [Proteus vulgaris]
MQISKLRLENYGVFTDADITLATKDDNENGSNITVFIGNNGSGKTSILDAIATGLSWFVAKLEDENAEGKSINKDKINLLSEVATISFDKKEKTNVTLINHSSNIDTDTLDFDLTTTRYLTNNNKYSSYASDNQIEHFSASYRHALRSKEKIELNFPITAYYGATRHTYDTTINNAIQPNNNRQFDILSAYKDALEAKTDYADFFAWFRYREDIENETAPHTSIMKLLEKHTDVNSEIYQSMLAEQKKLQDKALTAVREAIKIFLSDDSSTIENIYIERTPDLSMKVVKEGTHFSIEQLSYGEKSLLAMIGDIARRLTILNPTLHNPLEGKGIILIDEPDIHLHPQWQRRLISLLDKTFPNCQFVLTTHSPLLISEHKDILVYSIEKGQVEKVSSLYGQDINSVLSDIMDTDFINQKVQSQIGDILDAIQNADIATAKDLLTELEKEISTNNIEIVKARLLLKKKEVQLEKNQQKK